jgi:DNA mismatch repair protein MutS2
MNGFREGDAVLVKRLKQVGSILEVLPNQRYRISIGSLSLVCQERDLERGTATPTTSRAPAQTRSRMNPRPPETLDLHGHTVDDALRKLEEWLSRVVLSDLTHVKVIHGLGTGKVLNAVHRRLQELKAVRHFKISDFNPGETDVYL